MMIPDAVLASMTASQAAAAFNAAVREKYPNDTHLDLTEDATHWAGYGITTGLQLADYLDEAAEQEKEDMAYSMSHPYGPDDSAEPFNPIEQGLYDDDPSPYGGTYSEE